MEVEVRPEPDEDEREALVEALRVVRAARLEDPRGAWGKAALDPEADAPD